MSSLWPHSHTEKQVDMRSEVRCPKCKWAVHISQEIIEKGKELSSVPEAGSATDKAFSTLIVDAGDAITAGNVTEGHGAHDPGTWKGPLPAPPRRHLGSTDRYGDMGSL